MFNVQDRSSRIEASETNVDGLRKICRRLGRSLGWTSMASLEEILDYLVTVEGLQVTKLRRYDP